MDLDPFETAEAAGHPTVRQLSVFLDNRVGQLVRLAKLFEETDIRILALSVVNAVDCAVIRLLVSDPDAAGELLRRNGFAFSETEVLVVLLPPRGRGLLAVYSALLTAELDVQYTYPLLTHPRRQAAVVIQADNLEMAAKTLAARQIDVLHQGQLDDERP